MNFIQSFTHIRTETKHLLKEYERLHQQKTLKSKNVFQKNICLKYYDVVYRIWKKMKKVFVMMNPANVTVMRDQLLEEEIGRDNIVRKTIQSRNAIQQSSPFLH